MSWTLQIFEQIAMNEPVTTAELACGLGTDEHSLESGLAGLAYANWIWSDGSPERWQVSSIPAGLAMRSGRVRILDRAADQMVQLRKLVEHSVFLCALDGPNMVVLDVAASRMPFRKECSANNQFSMVSTSGMALQLAMSRTCRASENAPYGGDPADAIASDVLIRETGEFVGFAVALRDRAGFPIATLGIAVPYIRATPAYRARLHAHLVKAVLRCSEHGGPSETGSPVPALRG